MKLYPYLYRVKTKAAVLVANHDCLKKCVYRDIPLRPSRYREKFRGPMPEGKKIDIVPAKAWGGGPASLVRIPCVLPAPGNPYRYSPAQAHEGPSS